jgi:mannose/fructose/N-acetylgalactosamine-specific phosphotransferase system component IIB
MLSVVRIDERLVHGQVAYTWTVEYGIDRIVVVDDKAVNNQVQKMVLSLAVPPQKRFSLLETKRAIGLLKKISNEKVFLVVKSPKTILDLIKGGVEIKSINVGGMYYVPGRKKISKTVYINEEDRQVFLQLKDLGVKAEIRTAPKDKSLNLYNFI